MHHVEEFNLKKLVCQIKNLKLNFQLKFILIFLMDQTCGIASFSLLTTSQA